MADSGGSAGPNDLAMGECHARLDSLPRGATMSVNGRELGPSPMDVTGLPCDAPISFEARFERFEPWKRELTLSATKPGKIMASLRRPQVAVEISSTPPGALVTIGGKPAGKTPLKVEVNAFVKNPVKIALLGFKDFDTVVIYKPGKAQALVATLEKLPKTKVPLPFRPGAGGAGGAPSAPKTPTGTAPGGKPAAATPAKPGAAPTSPGTAKPGVAATSPGPTKPAQPKK
jgi:hypothetical protein